MILRCKHRHTIEEHPSCFAQGYVDDKDFEKKTGQPWYKYPAYRIGYLDIETTQLNGDYGFMLSWCIKEKDGKIYYDVISKKDLSSYSFDYRIVKSLIGQLKSFKIIITYYGDRFDLPFIRTRALYHKLEFPAYGEIYTWDLYWTVRSKLKLSRNTLENACRLVGIEGKTHLDSLVWMKASLGESTALKTVLEHNKADVEILEALHNQLEPFRKWLKRSI